jgi:hypothetical protein
MSLKPPCLVGALSFITFLVLGCARHQERPMITAVGLSPANRCDPPGIPYYLPKPLLVVAKNTRHIDESKVGLTAPVPIPAGFDNQAAYADIKANVTVPGTSATPASSGNTAFDQNITGGSSSAAQSMVAESMTPSAALDDGIEPDSFFTYQVIFVPDLTQKYGLQITGGAGEFRAAMNMVNGWMYTGMGPFYLKDSSSAQNAMSTGIASMYAGRGAADVLNEIGGLTTAIGNLPKAQEGGGFDSASDMAQTFEAIAAAAKIEQMVPATMLNYAEVYIYEPVLTIDGQNTEWRLVAEHHFDRDYFTSTDPAKTAEAKASIITSMIDALQKRQVQQTSQYPPNKQNDTVASQSYNEAERKQESSDYGSRPIESAPTTLLNPNQVDNLPEPPKLSLPLVPPLKETQTNQESTDDDDATEIDIDINTGENPRSAHQPLGLRSLLQKPQPRIKNRIVTQHQEQVN